MVINHVYKHLQVHVPKTGGTSLREMLLKNGWEGLNHHSTLGIFKADADKYKEYTKCVMVRNPWEHAVSFYGYLLWSKHFNPENFGLKRSKTIKHGDIKAEDLSFSNFIKSRYIKILYQSLHTNEFHDIGLKFDKWFDYANFDCMLRLYEKTFNIKIERNIRMQDKRKIDYVIDFDVDKPYQQYYDDETYDLVKKVSKKEIELFDYKF